MCKNIAELHLDYRKAFDNARGKFWATVGVIWAEAGIYTAIERSRMSRLTTLVLREVMLVEVWVHSVLKCRTLRRLHLHDCWCDKWTRPFPPAKVSEFVIQDIYHSPELEALATFLSPQLEVLEVHGKDWPGFPLAEKPLLPTLFPETCPRLRKYVLRLPISGSKPIIAPLREFLIRTTTIEDLELCVGFSPDTVPLPESALPDLRLYDATLSTGFLATHFINGPRKLAVLRIRDDFIRSYDRESLHNSLHVPYEVSELHLALHHRNAVFIPTQLDRRLPNIESLHFSMRVQQYHMVSICDPNVRDDQTVLDPVLDAVSEFVKSMKAAYSIQEGNDDCSKSLGFHKLKTVDVDIDVDGTIGTTPPALEKWFHDVVTANCPVLKGAHFRVWKVNNKGRREAGPRYWARWCMGSDARWYYEGGYTSEQEST